ncbi:hypothetical protein DRJ48_00690 [Candidatus Woesearchaeota archaeon]|nr:MAG: hypothetical protein DRJ48_00690 [Candidatus Woesearchaeota archaeon]
MIEKGVIMVSKKDREAEQVLPLGSTLLGKYSFTSNEIPVTVYIIKKKDDFVPTYFVSISEISEHTEIILDQIRDKLIEQVNLELRELLQEERQSEVEKTFMRNIRLLVEKYFPDLDEKAVHYLSTYLIQKSLGMGKIEILMDDPNLEEIAINSASEPVWVYQRKFGWLKTNIWVKSEDEIKHYATMIGRKVDRQISVLNPLMDANLLGGDRVNATMAPISLRGNTITLRKFASKPWTITDFIKNETISVMAAAILWLSVQYELSIIIAGGTASGKTSMLNVVANFFPPNQRIISIEDTHELRLPKFLHWIPMITRTPNPEGKGGITMLDLLVNSLRMRPDRLIVGEIRRQREAEVLFEAIHTGHSVYATVHANTAFEAITRLTSPPISIPKSMIPAVSVILVQFRNRRTGLRKTFQVAEVTETGDARVLIQYQQGSREFKETPFFKKTLARGNTKTRSTLFSKISLFTGMTLPQIMRDLEEKKAVLKWMVKNDVDSVDEVGRVMGLYYTNKEGLMEAVKANKKLGG